MLMVQSIKDLIENFYKTFGSGCFGLSNVTTTEYSGPIIICVSEKMPEIDVARNVLAYYYTLGTPAGSVASLVIIICGETKMSFRMYLDPSYEPHVDFLENLAKRNNYPILFVKYSESEITPMSIVYVNIEEEFRNFLNLFKALRELDEKIGERKSFQTAIRLINFILDNLIEETMVKICEEKRLLFTH